MLCSLNNRLEVSSPSRSMKKSYFYEDEDEFFYPCTNRVYESADDYEHFQADSE